MQSYLNGRQDSSRRARPQINEPQSPLTTLSAAPKKKAVVHAAHGAPEVECIKQGGRVTRIIVHCACGENIEIDCVYPEQSA